MDAAAAKISEVAAAQAGRDESRPYLTALPGSWPWTVAFMLSLAALGLSFYPAVLPLIFIMARSWCQSRYDFLIQLVLVIGGYGFIDSLITRINFGQFGFALGVMFAFLLRKNRIEKRLVAATFAYFVVMWALAIYDDESIRNQWSTINVFAEIIFFTVPLAIFAGRHFSFDTFVRSIFPYAMIACVFYIVDAFVLCGWVLVPRLQMWGSFSAFYDLVWSPFSGFFVRKYPPGLYILVLLLLPLAREYRLKPKYWLLVILAVISTQTFTFISGLVLVFAISQGGFRRTMKLGGVMVVGLVALYFVDESMGYTIEDGTYISPMRISSSVRQITDFVELTETANVDVEDMADFGSGRMAQVIPALDLMSRRGYHWHGLGFLNNVTTDVPAYMIDNDLFRDISNTETSIGQVEVTALRVYVYGGIIGLLAHILYFLYIYLAVRRLPRSSYLLCVMLTFVWFGIGGFEGLATHMSLTLVGVALAVPLLCARNNPVSDTSTDNER